MNSTQILHLIRQHKAELVACFGVVDLALFGSTARDAAREDSDVDVLMQFAAPASSATYFGVQFFREDLLGRPVDLFSDKALRPQLRPYIEKDALHV